MHFKDYVQLLIVYKLSQYIISVVSGIFTHILFMPINAHTFVSATKSRACPDGFNTKIFDVYQYNINITVLDPRFKLQWANHAEICAYKTTFAQKIWRISKLPHTSLHHIQKMTFLALSLRSNHMELWSRKSMIIS